MSEPTAKSPLWRGRLRRGIAWGALWAVGILGVIVIIKPSEPFKGCVHRNKNTAEYQELHERNPTAISVIITQPYLRSRLVLICASNFADRNERTIGALAAVALAVFTLYLWRATHGLRRYAGLQADDMQKLLRAAEDNASAAAGLRAAAEAQAKTAAEQHATLQEQTAVAVILSKAAVAVELPIIFVTDIKWCRGGLGTLEARLQFPLVNISFENFGRTPAFIAQTSITICEAYILPETPTYGAVISYPPPGTLLERGRHRTIQIGHRELSAAEIENIVNSNTAIWVFGCIVYCDFLKRLHEMGFCARMFCSKQADATTTIDFRFGYGPPEYTYDRERSPI
jgi:hypothetical protein